MPRNPDSSRGIKKMGVRRREFKKKGVEKGGKRSRGGGDFLELREVYKRKGGDDCTGQPKLQSAKKKGGENDCWKKTSWEKTVESSGRHQRGNSSKGK